MKDLSNEIRAYALRNAIEHGKALPEKILPKLFQHGLEKSEVKEVLPNIKEILNEINSLSKEEQESLFSQHSQFVKEREEQEEGLAELPNISDKMVFRLAPFPSGALHIGNAKTFLINALYAEKYNGTVLLVMDDTIGSEEKPLMKESYKLIEDAFKWLKIDYKKPVIYKSARMKIYYKYAEKLLAKGNAYVCHCPVDKLRENRAQGIECSCRQFPPKIQLERWKEMFKMKEGHATVRIKTSMMHPNPAFRDRVLFKISDREHPRVGKKFRVWPTLEMSWAVDDYLLGITHIIRGADLQIETDMEKFIWDIFGWKHPETIHTGLVNLEGVGAKISKSKAQKEVKSGMYSGWDDPRTWSIQSLRRRGILPEAIRQFVKSIGLNKQNISLPIENLYSINRKLIDADAKRFSFIANPIEIEIHEKPKLKLIEVPIHPDKEEMRPVKIGKIFISKDDYEKFKGQEIRLLHLYNIKLDSSKFEATCTSLANKDIQKINWVSDKIPCSVLLPDGSLLKGIAEAGIKTLKKTEILQFERFGFVKLDKKGEEYEFWFAHK